MEAVVAHDPVVLTESDHADRLDRMDRCQVEAVYRRHRRSLLVMLARRFPREPEPEDVVHEAFVALLASADRFEYRSTLLTWLWAVCWRIALDRARRGATRRMLLERERRPRVLPPDAEARISAQELLACAPVQIRTVAIDRWMFGRSCREIATDLGCSERYVGYMLLRFRSIARALSV